MLPYDAAILLYTDEHGHEHDLVTDTFVADLAKDELGPCLAGVAERLLGILPPGTERFRLVIAAVVGGAPPETEPAP